MIFIDEPRTYLKWMKPNMRYGRSSDDSLFSLMVKNLADSSRNSLILTSSHSQPLILKAWRGRKCREIIDPKKSIEMKKLTHITHLVCPHLHMANCPL